MQRRRCAVAPSLLVTYRCSREAPRALWYERSADDDATAVRLVIVSVPVSPLSRANVPLPVPLPMFEIESELIEPAPLAEALTSVANCGAPSYSPLSLESEESGAPVCVVMSTRHPVVSVVDPLATV